GGVVGLVGLGHDPGCVRGNRRLIVVVVRARVGNGDGLPGRDRRRRDEVVELGRARTVDEAGLAGRGGVRADVLDVGEDPAVVGVVGITVDAAHDQVRQDLAADGDGVGVVGLVG